MSRSDDKMRDYLINKEGEDELRRVKEEAQRAVDEMAAELLSQVIGLHDKTIETHWRLTQHNFFTNAGGAVAILGYLGATQTASFAIWPLCFFVIGLIASGIEIRILYYTFGNLCQDAATRHKKFIDNPSNVKESSIPNTEVSAKYGRWNFWSGVTAQSAFVLGVLSGVGGYLYSIYTISP